MKWMILLALATGPVWSQSQEELIKQGQEQALKTAQERATIQRLVTLKYVDPVAAQNLIKDFGVEIRADRQMKVVALSGRKAAVETAEAALKQLDVPAAAQKDIDLTVFFVVGTDANPSGAAIPQELQSTVAALKQTFPYKTYELLDALSLRSRAGASAGTTGRLSNNRLTSFNIGSVNLEGDGSMVRIDHLRAGVRQLQTLETSKSSYVDVSSVNTDVVDVKEGQKLVVGRASLDGPGTALFLVLIAKVAQ
jgi:hypothetical protein